MKKILLLISSCAVGSFAGATVSLTYSFGGLLAANSSPIALNSVGIVVADSTGNGFIGDYVSASADFNAFAGTSLSYGSAIGGSGDDIIVGVLSAIDLGGINGFNDSQTITLSGDLGANDNLALYWFPTVSSASIAGSVSEYGFFRTSNAADLVSSGSDIAFIMPSDGANSTLAVYSSSVGGGVADSALTAVAVPEPSTYAMLFGALALGFVAYRRRRS